MTLKNAGQRRSPIGQASVFVTLWDILLTKSATYGKLVARLSVDLMAKPMQSESRKKLKMLSKMLYLEYLIVEHQVHYKIINALRRFGGLA